MRERVSANDRSHRIKIKKGVVGDDAPRGGGPLYVFIAALDYVFR